MFYLSDICCICLNNWKDLRHMSDVDSNGISHYAKLSSCFQGLVRSKINKCELLCAQCCGDIDFVYQFHCKCLANGNMMKKYLSQLQTIEKTEAVVSVCVIDFVKSNMKQERTNPYYESEEIVTKISDFNTGDYGHAVYLPDICDRYIKTENSDLETENVAKYLNTEYEITGNEDIKNHLFNEFSDKERTEGIKHNVESPVHHIDTERLIPDVDMESILEGINGEDLGDSCDPLMNPVDIKSDIETVEESQHKSDPLLHMTSRTVGEDLSSLQEISLKPDMCVNIFVPKKSVNVSDQRVKQHECTVCQKKFRWPCDLQRHALGHTGIKKFECRVCEKKFRRLDYLEDHMLIHTADKKYECNICHKKYGLISSFRKHMLIHSGVKPHECIVCGKRFICASSLKRHKLIHADIKQFECNVCQKKFGYFGTLKQHLKIHTEVKSHQCNICQKTFCQATGFKQHMLTHTGFKSHECGICQMKFNQAGNLNKHMILHTGAKPHECTVCQKRFRQSSTLCRHLMTHTGIMPHECSVCQRKFTRASYLRRHMLRHTENTPHECNICKRQFTILDYLKRHMLVHSKDKPFECNICQKKFGYIGSYNKHMLIHTADKTHECNICGKKFNLVGNLNKHMTIHSDIKPYECKICNRKFRQSSNLNSHLLIHTGLKKHECNICQKKFSRGSNFKKHMLIHSWPKNSIKQEIDIQQEMFNPEYETEENVSKTNGSIEIFKTEETITEDFK